MAHNINQSRAKASMVSVKEIPWHGLGQVVEEALTSAEAMEQAQLDYNVELAPVTCNLVNVHGEPIIGTVDDKFVTYRTDTCETFGVVGARYNIVQNVDAFGFFDAIVGSGEAIFETAGALGKGETIFITAKLPGSIRVGNNDDIDKYLLLTMGHDGKNSIQAMFTPIRVVCNNTLNSALNMAAKKVSIRHTRNANENLKNAHKVLGITSKLSAEVEAVLNQLAKTRITDSVLEEAIIKTFLDEQELKELALTGKLTMVNAENSDLPLQRRKVLSSVYDYAFTGPGQQFATCKGTAFGFYNAITGYFQNVKEFKSDEKRMTNNLLTTNYRTMEKAFNLAMSL